MNILDVFKNIVSFLWAVFLLLCVFGFFYALYENNRAITNFEAKCREVYIDKKIYKSYCSCLAYGAIDLSNNSQLLRLSFVMSERQGWDKDGFHLFEEMVKTRNQCNFETSYIKFFKESLIK